MTPGSGKKTWESPMTDTSVTLPPTASSPLSNPLHHQVVPGLHSRGTWKEFTVPSRQKYSTTKKPREGRELFLLLTMALHPPQIPTSAMWTLPHGPSTSLCLFASGLFLKLFLRLLLPWQSRSTVQKGRGCYCYRENPQPGGNGGD